jgi:hypothetical protein
MAPLYRLPLMTYQSSYPVLLTDGAVSESEVHVLERFFSQVQDINRGLDNAAEMHKAANQTGLTQEFQRNCLKARSLVEAEGGGQSLYMQALQVVDRNANLAWWLYASEA